MKKKLYFVWLFFILFVSISSLTYMQLKYYDLENQNIALQKENNELKKQLPWLYENKDYFEYKNRSFDNFTNIDKYIKEMEKQFNNIPKNDFFHDFNMNIDINPWIKNQMNFFKHFLINDKNFTYSIQSLNNKINWKVIWEDKSILKDIEDKLKKFWLKTEIKNDTLYFEWENIDTNKIIWWIDDYINQYYQDNTLKSWKNKENQKNENSISWQNYF